VNEARRLGIPVVAIVDTKRTGNHRLPIAGNDDAIRAIRVILQKLVDAIVAASNEARLREQVEMAACRRRRKKTSNAERRTRQCSMKTITEIDRNW